MKHKNRRYELKIKILAHYSDEHIPLSSIVEEIETTETCVDCGKVLRKENSKEANNLFSIFQEAMHEKNPNFFVFPGGVTKDEIKEGEADDQ